MKMLTKKWLDQNVTWEKGEWRVLLLSTWEKQAWWGRKCGGKKEGRKEGLRGSKLFKRRLPSHSVLASCRSFHRYALRLWWRWTGLWNRIQIHKAFSFFNWHLWCKANAFPYNSRHIHTHHAQACDWVWLRQSGIPRVSAGIDGYQDQTMTA